MPTDTTSLKISVDSRGVKIADKNLNDLSKTSSKAEGATNKLTTATSKLNVQNILTAAAVYKLSSEFIKLSDTYSNMNSLLKLVTKDSKDLADTQQSLFEIAQKSRSGYEGTVELYAKIARSTKSLNLESSELLRITETINKTGIISGGSAQSIDASLTQLGQAFASGTLRGEELNSVLEQTPRLAQAIADGMGYEVGALRSLAAQGKITSEVLVQALQSQSQAVDAEFKRMALTVDGASVTIGNSILDVIGRFNDATGASRSLAESINEFGLSLTRNADDIVAYGQFTYATISRTVDIFNLLWESVENGVEIVGSGVGTVVYGTMAAISEMVEQTTRALHSVNLSSDETLAEAISNNEKMQAALRNSVKTIQDSAKEVNDALLKASPTVEDRVAEMIEKNATEKIIKEVQNRGKLISAAQAKADEESFKQREKHLAALVKLDEDYMQAITDITQKTAEQRLEGLDQEALQTFNYYDNLMIKYAEVAGAEATLRQLQTEAIDEIIVKMKEQDEAFENTKAIDALDAINDRYEKILDSQIAIAENGMNIDFDLDGVAKDLNNVSKAIQSMHVGSLKYTKEDIKLQNNYAKAYLAAGKDIEKQAKAESEFNADQATLKESRQNAEMAGYASLAGAMASAFEQGSKGAIAFTALQSALGIASSWTAIAQAWALPFPANIPAAAMVASQVMPIIGQLGGSSSGSGGGASAPSAKEVAIKNVEDTYTPITDRLDRQIELMESLDLKGSMGITQIALSQAEFAKASALAKVEFETGMLDTWDSVLQSIATKTVKQGYATAGTSYMFGGTPSMTVRQAEEELSLTIMERIARISKPIEKNWYGIVNPQYATQMAEYNELIGLAQEAINDYAISMVDTVAEMKDAGKTFEELFDSITQTSKYAELELKKAQADVAKLTRGNSLESYLEKQISAINQVSESFGMNIQKLLLSTNKADLQRQAEAVDALAIASNRAFVGGVEEALNFLDSIELVGEALANSRENTKEYLDSFKTEDQLTKELAKTLGVTLANSFNELDVLFKKLSISGGLLTDTELELLTANKALIETRLEEEKALAETNATNYINELTASLSKLEPITNTLRSTIDNLRASSMTSEQNLSNFYEAMNEATTLSTSGSYEDFATAVQKATSLSSVLNNAENFSLSRDMDFAKLVAANQFESLESITLKEIDYLRMIVENTDPLKEASTSYGFGGATSVPSITQSVVNPNLSGAYVQNDNVNVVSALSNQNVLLNAIITKQDTQITILRESRDIQNGSLVVLENIEAVS